MKLGLTSYLLAFLLTFSWACGGPRDMLVQPQDVPTFTTSPMSTDGPIWVAETLNGAPVIKGTVLTLSTGGDSAGGGDGCNSFAGSHEDGSLVARPGGTISFPGFVRTLALCEYPRGTVAQQDNYLAALADGREFQTLGNRLEIRDGSGKVRLVMVNKSPLVGEAVDLTGTAWRLVSSDGKSPRGSPPTFAVWDERFVGGTVDGYGYVAQYDKWKTNFRVLSIALTEAGTMRASHIPDQDVRDFLRDVRRPAGHAVREEGGTRLLRIRTSRGAPLDFEELMPVVDNIAGAEWRLKSFIEVREGETRAGGPPCTEDVLPGASIVARFTETSVSGTVGSREYSHDNLSLSVVRPGERDADASDDRDTDLPNGRCPREDREEASEPDISGQAERYLELLPQLRRAMIFGDRLVVLTDSQQALLFQADRPG